MGQLADLLVPNSCMSYMNPMFYTTHRHLFLLLRMVFLLSCKSKTLCMKRKLVVLAVVLDLLAQGRN